MEFIYYSSGVAAQVRRKYLDFAQQSARKLSFETISPASAIRLMYSGADYPQHESAATALPESAFPVLDTTVTQRYVDEFADFLRFLTIFFSLLLRAVSPKVFMGAAHASNDGARFGRDEPNIEASKSFV